MQSAEDATPLISMVEAILGRIDGFSRPKRARSQDEAIIVKEEDSQGEAPVVPEADADASQPSMENSSSTSQSSVSRPIRLPASLRNPFSCELLTKSTSKGFYESKYVDLPLTVFGCMPIIDPAIPFKAKQLVGKPCCYLRLGTSLVITGTVVEVSPENAQIAPDKGQTVSVEWVQFIRLYHIPDNISTIRRDVGLRVMETLAAIRDQSS